MSVYIIYMLSVEFRVNEIMGASFLAHLIKGSKSQSAIILCLNSQNMCILEYYVAVKNENSKVIMLHDV